MEKIKVSSQEVILENDGEMYLIDLQGEGVMYLGETPETEITYEGCVYKLLPDSQPEKGLYVVYQHANDTMEILGTEAGTPYEIIDETFYVDGLGDELYIDGWEGEGVCGIPLVYKKLEMEHAEGDKVKLVNGSIVQIIETDPTCSNGLIYLVEYESGLSDWITESEVHIGVLSAEFEVGMRVSVGGKELRGVITKAEDYCELGLPYLVKFDDGGTEWCAAYELTVLEETGTYEYKGEKYEEVTEIKDGRYVVFESTTGMKVIGMATSVGVPYEIFNGHQYQNDDGVNLRVEGWKSDYASYKIYEKVEEEPKFEEGDIVVITENTNDSRNEVGDIGVINDVKKSVEFDGYVYWVEVEGRSPALTGAWTKPDEMRHATPIEVERKKEVKPEYKIGDIVVITENTNDSRNMVGDIGKVVSRPHPVALSDGMIFYRVEVEGREDYDYDCWTLEGEMRLATDEEIEEYNKVEEPLMNVGDFVYSESTEEICVIVEVDENDDYTTYVLRNQSGREFWTAKTRVLALDPDKFGR